jgi:hypothetical protein
VRSGTHHEAAVRKDGPDYEGPRDRERPPHDLVQHHARRRADPHALEQDEPVVTIGWGAHDRRVRQDPPDVGGPRDPGRRGPATQPATSVTPARRRGARRRDCADSGDAPLRHEDGGAAYPERRAVLGEGREAAERRAVGGDDGGHVPPARALLQALLQAAAAQRQPWCQSLLSATAPAKQTLVPAPAGAGRRAGRLRWSRPDANAAAQLGVVRSALPANCGASQCTIQCSQAKAVHSGPCPAAPSKGQKGAD